MGLVAQCILHLVVTQYDAARLLRHAKNALAAFQQKSFNLINKTVLHFYLHLEATREGAFGCRQFDCLTISLYPNTAAREL